MDLKFIVYRWLNTPEIRKNLILTPQVSYNFRGERLYGEFTSTIWYENCHNSAPVDSNGNKPLMVIIVFEVDKTPVSRGGKFIRFNDFQEHNRPIQLELLVETCH